MGGAEFACKAPRFIDFVKPTSAEVEFLQERRLSRALCQHQVFRLQRRVWCARVGRRVHADTGRPLRERSPSPRNVRTRGSHQAIRGRSRMRESVAVSFVGPQ
eukprot:3482245-Pyramimonas_sp.AAC.1